MERNQQYDHICQTIFTRPMGFCSGCKDSKSTLVDEPHCKVKLAGNFVEDSDFVIWLGDLNYRVEMPRDSVGLLISHNLEEVFLTYYLYTIHSYTCAWVDLESVFGYLYSIQYSPKWSTNKSWCRHCGPKTNYKGQCNEERFSRSFLKGPSCFRLPSSLILEQTHMILVQRWVFGLMLA
jgi:hypothetical protein